MAKILSVCLESVPEVIIVNDDHHDFTVVTEIEFHELDIQFNMEYCLHLFVYEIHGELDAPLVMPNWDECKVITFSKDRQDNYLGTAKKSIQAKQKLEKVKIPVALKLGNQSKTSSHFSKKLRVFATIAPAIGRASKWSKLIESRIEY